MKIHQKKGKEWGRLKVDFKCNKCDRTAEYVVDGQSVCAEHKDNGEPDEKNDRTAGERMAGGF